MVHSNISNNVVKLSDLRVSEMTQLQQLIGTYRTNSLSWLER